MGPSRGGLSDRLAFWDLFPGSPFPPSPSGPISSATEPGQPPTRVKPRLAHYPDAAMYRARDDFDHPVRAGWCRWGHAHDTCSMSEKAAWPASLNGAQERSGAMTGADNPSPHPNDSITRLKHHAFSRRRESTVLGSRLGRAGPPCDGRKLALVNAGLTDIGAVPQAYRTVTVMLGTAWACDSALYCGYNFDWNEVGVGFGMGACARIGRQAGMGGRP